MNGGAQLSIRMLPTTRRRSCEGDDESVSVASTGTASTTAKPPRSGRRRSFDKFDFSKVKEGKSKKIQHRIAKLIPKSKSKKKEGISNNSNSSSSSNNNNKNNRRALSLPEDSLSRTIATASTEDLVRLSSLRSLGSLESYSFLENDELHNSVSLVSCKLRDHSCKPLGGISYPFIESELLEAMEESRITGRPVILVNRGEVLTSQTVDCSVLRHPLIVEAAETLFISVSETDSTKFQEEISNISNFEDTSNKISPTLRILDAFELEDSLIDIAEPVEENRWSVGHVAAAMVCALGHKSDQPIPRYLELIVEEECCSAYNRNENSHKKQRIAFFAVRSSWMAEVEFAGLNGVLATKSGTMSGARAIQVNYDSGRLSYSTLVQFALSKVLIDAVYFHTKDEMIVSTIELRQAQMAPQQLQKYRENAFQPCVHESKHALRKTPLRYVPMSGMQTTQANRLVHLGKFHEALELLSPRQRVILLAVMRYKKRAGSLCDVIDVPLSDAWQKLSESGLFDGETSEDCRLSYGHSSSGA